MAKGAESKTTITAKILEVFPNAFVYDKEIRIPMEEGGEQVQIKCVLTCAKTNVECGGATPTPNVVNPSFVGEVTEEEKSEVENLIESLGL